MAVSSNLIQVLEFLTIYFSFQLESKSDFDLMNIFVPKVSGTALFVSHGQNFPY